MLALMLMSFCAFKVRLVALPQVTSALTLKSPFWLPVVMVSNMILLVARLLAKVVGGHEIIGTITQLGSEAKGLKVGQRVGIGWTAESCQHCDPCVSGQQVLCTGGSVATIFDACRYVSLLSAELFSSFTQHDSLQFYFLWEFRVC